MTNIFDEELQRAIDFLGERVASIREAVASHGRDDDSGSFAAFRLECARSELQSALNVRVSDRSRAEQST